MAFKSRSERKYWSTDFIRKWFLSSGYSYMAFQSWIHRKCRYTNFTRKWFLSCVCSHVPFQMVIPWKWRPIEFTRIWFFLVCPQVCFCKVEPHMSQENSSPPVYLYVTFQSGSQRKYCSTNFTRKWFPGSVWFCVFTQCWFLWKHWFEDFTMVFLLWVLPCIFLIFIL